MFRHVLRRSVARAIDLAPQSAAYWLRGCMERFAFNRTPLIHDLPQIFHYWSNTYLRPRLEAIGFSSPDDFFFRTIAAQAALWDGRLRCLSVGAGRCETELALARRLRAQGLDDIVIVCTDLNPQLLRAGERCAHAAGLADRFVFEVADISRRQPGRRYDVIIANQCLHHFVELETILDNIHALLDDDGVLGISDVIGRNGHQLWPEALEEFLVFWRELAPRQRYDRVLRRRCDEYINYNHADVGFEGIRAQDILPLLVERFGFAVFAPYACIALPLVERRFGANFDPANRADRAFVDRLAQRDQALLDAGRLKPTQLIAALHKQPVAATRSTTHFSPAACIRATGED